MGTERTRSELLPYIIGKFKRVDRNLDLMDDEEEVLLTLAEVLGEFLDYIGGPNHALSIIKCLEKLCSIEEASVREKVNLM